MGKKIEWYQEVLALEPGSRIFFPLAKQFVELGQFDEAVKVLRQGLDRHPDAMEARLLLIQLLTRLERYDEAQEHLSLVVKPLERYPAFWSLWAQRAAATDRDLAVFLMLVASHFTDKPLKWTDVVIEGLHSLSERLIGPISAGVRRARENAAASVPAAEKPAVEDAPEVPYDGPTPDAGSFRTRTMADLLASQGDFGGALGIYREILAHAEDEQEKSELSARINTLEQNLAAQQAAPPAGEPEAESDPFGKHAKNRLMSTLEALAARLEARIQA